MAKFLYRMQNILDIKNKMETQAKQHYAMCRLRVDEESEKLDLMFKRKSQLEAEYRKLATGTINVRDLLDGRHAIDYQKEMIKVQMIELRVAEKNFELAAKRLNEAVKERKTQEKLREKAFDNFLMELGEQEKKEIDELVSYRYGQEDKE